MYFSCATTLCNFSLFSFLDGHRVFNADDDEIEENEEANDE
jgi:hypothetical protein